MSIFHVCQSADEGTDQASKHDFNLGLFMHPTTFELLNASDCRVLDSAKKLYRVDMMNVKVQVILRHERKL